MDNERKIEIPFGEFDSELIHQEINIPNGFNAVIEGDKIILTRIESEDEKVRKALIEMVRDRTGDELWVDYNVHKEEVLAWLEKQGEQKPIEWDADDDDKFFFLKARLKDYEDCIIYDEELSECQKHNVRETTKEFLEWLDSIKERIGG
jgi:hypothetical protein